MRSISHFLDQKQDNFLILRVVAALLVIYGHSIPLTMDHGSIDIFLRLHWPVYSGDVAVFIFFTISGFLVTGSYLANQNGYLYYLNRIFRIVPAYLLVLVVSVLIIGPVFTTEPLHSYFGSSDTRHYLTQNLMFLPSMSWMLPGVFEHHRYTAVNGSLWSIPVEVWMYILVAMLGIFGCLRYRFLTVFVITAFMLAAFFKPAFFPEWSRPCAFFFVGILAQLYKRYIPVRHDIFLCLAILSYFAVDTKSYIYVLGVTISYFCFWFAYLTPRVNIESWGDPSYGIYLWGWPIQQIMIEWFPHVTPMLNFLCCVPIAVGLGYLSWHYIESPALMWKVRIGHLLPLKRYQCEKMVHS